jgi:hypothetical protein
VALRAFLAAKLGGFHWPAHSYVVLRRTPHDALYGHVSRPGRVNQYVMITQSGGQWRYLNNGGCAPMRVFSGSETATFTLAGRPKPGSRSLKLTVESGTCYPPRPSRPPRHVSRVLLSWQPHRLLLTILLRPEPPSRFCAGVGVLFKITVQLHRVLGPRTAYHGVYFPPVRAEIS